MATIVQKALVDTLYHTCINFTASGMFAFNKSIDSVESLEQHETKTDRTSKTKIQQLFNYAKVSLKRQKTEDFIDLLFWHSMVMTLPTPLARLTRGKWASVSILYWGALIFFWLVSWQIDIGVIKHSEERHFDESLVYRTDQSKENVDFAFGLHAFFGILWILVGWVQMFILPKFKFWHRKFGIVAIISFILHMASSFYIVYVNYMKHTPIPRLLLYMFGLDSIVCFAISFLYARRDDYMGHRDAMFRSFVYSIEGAGTIRTIATFQEFLGFGPDACRVRGYGVGTSCLYSYTWRLLLTRYLSVVYLGIYTTHKNNSNFTRSFFMELIWFSMIAALLLNPTRVAAIDLFFQDYPFTATPAFLSIVTIMKGLILHKSNALWH